MYDKNTVLLQSYTDVQSVECGSSSEGGEEYCDDSSEGGEEYCGDSKGEMSIKIEEEEMQIKEEEEPIAIAFPPIKDEPEVSPQTFHQYIGLLSVIMSFCLPAFPHKSAHCVVWKLSVYI